MIPLTSSGIGDDDADAEIVKMVRRRRKGRRITLRVIMVAVILAIIGEIVVTEH